MEQLLLSRSLPECVFLLRSRLRLRLCIESMWSLLLPLYFILHSNSDSNPALVQELLPRYAFSVSKPVLLCKKNPPRYRV